MFYSNLDSRLVWDTESDDWLWTSVYGQQIRLTPQIIGRLLNCSSTGENLYYIPDMRFIQRNNVTHQIWEEDMPRFVSKYLRPKARLLTRMLINTVIPRLGSHEQITELEHKALYAIFNGTQVNWAQFIFDELKIIGIILAHRLSTQLI